jgi:choline monooxygenase
MMSIPILPEDLEIQAIERASTIPAYWYYNHELFEWEKQQIFSRNWIYATHRSQLKKSNGSTHLFVGNEPIIIFEHKSGSVKAFINVCRHRGGPLCLRKGSKDVLQCQYHGWTYTSEGELRGVPEFDRVELFNKSDFTLIELPVFEFQGLVFVNIKSNNSFNAIQTTCLDIEHDLGSLQLSHFEFSERVSYPLACNWKVYIDNYLEGYHIPHVHPELNKLLDYRTYQTKTFDFHSLQQSRFKDGESVYKSGSDEDQAFYYFIYPNCMLNILPSRLQVNVVEPVDAQHCVVHFDYFYDHRFYDETRIQADKAYADFVQKEDQAICEQVQRGLRSASYHQGRFSVKQEQGVYHFQTLLKKNFKASQTESQ